MKYLGIILLVLSSFMSIQSIFLVTTNFTVESHKARMILIRRYCTYPAITVILTLTLSLLLNGTALVRILEAIGMVLVLDIIVYIVSTIYNRYLEV